MSDNNPQEFSFEILEGETTNVDMRVEGEGKDMRIAQVSGGGGGGGSGGGGGGGGGGDSSPSNNTLADFFPDMEKFTLTEDVSIRELARDLYAEVAQVSLNLKERVLRKVNWQLLLNTAETHFKKDAEISFPRLKSPTHVDAVLMDGFVGSEEKDRMYFMMTTRENEFLSQLTDRMVAEYKLDGVNGDVHKDFMWQIAVRNGIYVSADNVARVDSGWHIYIRDEMLARNGRLYNLRPSQSEDWPWGPQSQRKSRDVSYDHYLKWVIALEEAYGAGDSHQNKDIISRLRRFYFSRYSGAAGKAFEQVIPTPEDPPAHKNKLSQEALDGLFATNNILTRTGNIDPGHLWASLDLRLSGVRALPGTRHWADRMYAQGTLTWIGDLASWFTSWNVRRKAFFFLEYPKLLAKQSKSPPEALKLDGLFYAIVNSKVSVDDLISDMDALIFLDQYIETHAIVTDAYVRTFHEMNKKVSELLREGYGPSRVAGAKRFRDFVKVAIPKLAHEVNGDQVILKPEARKEIYLQIRDTANLFTSAGWWGQVKTTVITLDDLKNHEVYIRRIAYHFWHFLEQGLKDGTLNWPPTQAPSEQELDAFLPRQD